MEAAVEEAEVLGEPRLKQRGKRSRRHIPSTAAGCGNIVQHVGRPDAAAVLDEHRLHLRGELARGWSRVEIAPSTVIMCDRRSGSQALWPRAAMVVTRSTHDRPAHWRLAPL